MRDPQIKKIKTYLIKKYNGRLTLKIDQVADEFLMSRDSIKRLKIDGLLSSLSCNVVAAYIVNNPPLNTMSQST
jgi:hypothetical protein